MKKYLRKYWKKNNLTILNITTLLLYGIGLFLFDHFGFVWIINIVGFWYLIILTPLNIASFLKIQVKGIIEWLLVAMSIFFTIITPIYFVANYLFHIPFSFKILLLVNVIISIISICFTGIFSKEYSLPDIKKITAVRTVNLVKAYWPLILILFLYAILHIINYHFYIFIPEWDGYSDLISIKNVSEMNSLTTGYRGFFTVAVVIISKFSKIPPYEIFSFWFIVLQATLILVMYKFIRIYKIENKFHQFILLLSTLAIPVLNMEIDVVRPQTVFIILTPIYIYFLFKAIELKQYSYWLITTLIIIAGLNYHEFFLFLLITHLVVLFTTLYKKYHLNGDRKDHLIFYMSFVIIFLLIVVFAQHFYFLKYLTFALKKIIRQISNIHQWRWWFLDNYAGDTSGQQLGWPGISGAIKYYAYYASPIVICTLISTVYFATKRQLKRTLLLLWPIGFLIIFLLLYCELLPRLNYIYLPERIWLIITILTITFIPPITTTIKKRYSEKSFKIYLNIIIILSVIGIGGSFYIAKNKKALTNKNEYQAVLWIKNNTPTDATFISQPANKPMIKFFAERDFIPASINTFNNGNMLTINKPDTHQTITVDLHNIQELLQATKINTPADLEKIIHTLDQIKTSIIQSQHNSISNKKNPTLIKPSLYILYSKNKFNNLYAQREWWLKTNSYNAKIENLNKKYPLIYNKNEVYIWKVQ